MAIMSRVAASTLRSGRTTLPRIFPRAIAHMSTAAPPNKKRKIVVVGAGFIGKYVAKALISNSENTVLLTSRNPTSLYTSLSSLGSQLLPPVSLDITGPSTLAPAFEGADCVISLVGILTGKEKDFVRLQQEGGRNVAEACKKAGVGRVVMVSALGADMDGDTPYARTKALAENSFLENVPSATIIRPSLVFGPGDQFFARFATLAKYLPFLPTFGLSGPYSKFQPVYVGDLAKGIEVLSRADKDVVSRVGGKIVEAGGPEVFTFRQLMQLVLKYTGLSSRRLILPLPWPIALLQASILQLLPLPPILQLTVDQVKQLKHDNAETTLSANPARINLADILEEFPPAMAGSSFGSGGLRGGSSEGVLKSVHEILPRYIGPKGADGPESGKRKHGRDHLSGDEGLDEIKKMLADAKIPLKRDVPNKKNV